MSFCLEITSLSENSKNDFQQMIRNRFNVLMSNHIEAYKTSLGTVVMPVGKNQNWHKKTVCF